MSDSSFFDRDDTSLQKKRKQSAGAAASRPNPSGFDSSKDERII